MDFFLQNENPPSIPIFALLDMPTLGYSECCIVLMYCKVPLRKSDIMDNASMYVLRDGSFKLYWKFATIWYISCVWIHTECVELRMLNTSGSNTVIWGRSNSVLVLVAWQLELVIVQCGPKLGWWFCFYICSPTYILVSFFLRSASLAIDDYTPPIVQFLPL